MSLERYLVSLAEERPIHIGGFKPVERLRYGHAPSCRSWSEVMFLVMGLGERLAVESYLIIFYGTHCSNNLWRCTDPGVTWSKVINFTSLTQRGAQWDRVLQPEAAVGKPSAAWFGRGRTGS